MRHKRVTVTVAAAVAAVAVAVILLATGTFGASARDGLGAGSQGTGGPGSGGGVGAAPLRLGFVADVQQATALTGVRAGLFAAQLRRAGFALRPVAFRSDAAETAALASGRLDAAYASPATILTVLAASHAGQISVVSGAAAGGAELVVRRSITAAGQLRGRTVAVPSAGGSQDFALRSWLVGHRIGVGRGGVTVRVVSPGAVAGEFRAGRISGAWMPAPVDVELAGAGGRVLAADEGLPPGSVPAAANLVVKRAYLSEHSAAVAALLKGQVQANDFVQHNLLGAAAAVNAELAAVTGRGLPTSVLAASMAQITFTDDPQAAWFAAQARQSATRVSSALPVLYDLAPLNLILRMAGERPVGA